MAALLVGLAVMAVAMTVALPAWRQANRREKEEELVFRGRQYVRAVQLFQRKFAATYPPDIDTLVRQKFLRKKYKDPMVEDGEFEALYQGSQLTMTTGTAANRGGATGGARQGAATFTFDSRSGAITQGAPTGQVVGPRGGVLGVRSKSTDESIRVYNGATHYNEWQFVFVPTMPGAGQRGPGMRGGQGQDAPGGMGFPGGMPGGGRGAGPGDRGGMRGGPPEGQRGPGGPRGGPGGGPGGPGAQRGGRGFGG
jgi:type II secretory pathway pseudopilin PulG